VIKLVVLWKPPADADGFENDYTSTHLALIDALPGKKGAVASKALNGPYFRMAEMIFDSPADLKAAMSSEAGQKLMADGQRLQETYGTSFDVLTVEETARV
jgi:uncharacterized protein (TIGR02118 family)